LFPAHRIDETSVAFQRIKSQSQQIQRRILDVLPQHGWLSNRRERVQIGDKVERLLMPLQCDVLSNRSEVVAPVKSPGWAECRKEFSLVCHSIDLRLNG
jgi:hypothetical protein